MFTGATLIEIGVYIQPVLQTEINFRLSSCVKQRRNPCSGPPGMYRDLSTRHDWPVKKANPVEGKFETHFR